LHDETVTTRPPAQEPQTKGGAMLSTVKALRAQREAALARLPSSLHHYLNERILPASWYPERDVHTMLRVLAQLMPLPPGSDVWELFGKMAAQNDFNGTYRAFLRPGDPAGTLEGACGHWGSFHDTGEMTTLFDGPGSALVTLRNYGLVAAEMCRLNGAYMCSVLAIAGAKKARSAKLECRAAGAPQCTWRISWE
jgi:hypothetical protein